MRSLLTAVLLLFFLTAPAIEAQAGLFGRRRARRRGNCGYSYGYATQSAAQKSAPLQKSAQKGAAVLEAPVYVFTAGAACANCQRGRRVARR